MIVLVPGREKRDIGHVRGLVMRMLVLHIDQSAMGCFTVIMRFYI